MIQTNVTPVFGDSSRCASCKHCVSIRGAQFKDAIDMCGAINRRITFKVVSCQHWVPANHPWVYEMEQIAWDLCTAKGQRDIGFRPPSERTTAPSMPPARFR